MKFITLTIRDGDSIYINVEKIAGVFPHEAGSNISIQTSTKVTVRETPSQVLALINA